MLWSTQGKFVNTVVLSSGSKIERLLLDATCDRPFMAVPGRLGKADHKHHQSAVFQIKKQLRLTKNLPQQAFNDRPHELGRRFSRLQHPVRRGEIWNTSVRDRAAI